MGRKVPLIDRATGNKHTDCPAINNTLIGVWLLVGSVGAQSPFIGDAGIIALSVAIGFAGVLPGTTLP